MLIGKLARTYPPHLRICDNRVVQFHFAYLHSLHSLAGVLAIMEQQRLTSYTILYTFMLKDSFYTHMHALLLCCMQNWCMLCSELRSIQRPPLISKEYAVVVVSHMSVTQFLHIHVCQFLHICQTFSFEKFQHCTFHTKCALSAQLACKSYVG